MGLCSAVGEKARNEVKQGATLSPSQTIARLASIALADLFFAFSATAEPGLRLLMLGYVSPLPS